MADETIYDDDEVIELDPDYSLKEKIGMDANMANVFSHDIIKKSQDSIDASQKDFLKWVEKDLADLEVAYAGLKKDAASEEQRDALKKAAFSVKSQAGTFGFNLTSSVARSLVNFCENDYKPQPEHLIVIRKHIDTLRTSIHSNITGDGGKLGAAMLDALQQLVTKFAS